MKQFGPCPKCGYKTKQPNHVTAVSHVCPKDGVDRQLKKGS